MAFGFDPEKIVAEQAADQKLGATLIPAEDSEGAARLAFVRLSQMYKRLAAIRGTRRSRDRIENNQFMNNDERAVTTTSLQIAWVAIDQLDTQIMASPYALAAAMRRTFGATLLKSGAEVRKKKKKTKDQHER